MGKMDFAEKFPDAKRARKYLENRRWQNGVSCPFCCSHMRIQIRRQDGYYRCLSCQKDFTVRTGTILERSHVALDKWLWAIYKVIGQKEKVSSVQLAKELKVTQKTAWKMLQRMKAVDVRYK